MSGSEERRPRWSVRAALVAALGVSLLVGCKGRSEGHASPTKVNAEAPATSRSRAKPELAHRTQQQPPLEQFVQQHVEDADASGKRVIVYVGASWCEPCQRFHKALESGELDESLAGTKFIEFDADRDLTELRAAGYASKYIPLFSLPDQSGHASGKAIEGSVKGDSAVRESLVPRLLALLDGKPTE